MPTNFILTLDTTGPGGVTVAIAGGAAYTPAQAVNLDVGTTDPSTAGYQIKAWGDVVGAADEAAAGWVAYADPLAITLTPGDGLKTVTIRLRDDVGNESATASDTITLDTTTAVPTITVEAAPTKISKVPGFNVSTFSFASSDDVQAWEVRVVPDANSSRDTGAVLDSGGALAADTNQQVQITGADLEAASAGDGPKVIKVFVQDMGTDNWSA
jgi:hypothetical protein